MDSIASVLMGLDSSWVVRFGRIFAFAQRFIQYIQLAAEVNSKLINKVIYELSS